MQGNKVRFGWPLGKKIGDERTGGNRPRLELDFHRVEAMDEIVTVEQFEIAVGGATKRFFLAGVDGISRSDDGVCGAGFDFDEDEHIAVTANQVDLAARGFVITGQDLVAVTSDEGGGDPLTIIPDLRRRQQLGRRSALVSA